MVADTNQIRTRPVPACILCGGKGQVLYDNLPDRSFSAPGLWSLLQCEKCGLTWLNPQPVPEDIGKAYQGYYTHNQPEPGPNLVRDTAWAVWKSYLRARFGYTQGVGPSWMKPFWPLALLHPGGRDELDQAAMYMPAPRGPARLLDVGSGSGIMLARMQSLGWEVQGVEVDPEAVKTAQRRGVPVRQGSLEEQKFPDNYFDAVHSAHVLEHVYDPLSLLRECRRILKPGGKLIILTPNMQSWGHRKFRSAWLNIDPPRHLVLFSPENLRTAAEQSGLKIQRLGSTVRAAWVYGALSSCIASKGRGEMNELGKPANLLKGLTFQLRERAVLARDPYAGDELLLIGTKE